MILKNLFFLSILRSLVLFTNCGESDDPVADTPSDNTDDNNTDEGAVSEEIIANGRVEDYDAGTLVQLTATSSEGWKFDKWVELDVDTNPLEVSITDSVTLTARFYVPIDSISITPSALSLAPGESGTLTANILPSNATDTTFAWTSSNETIATIDQLGIVTAITAGETTITAVSNKGGIEAVASVTVATPVTGLTINPQSKEINIGSTAIFTASISPSNATDTTVTWTSSNETIATIDQSGIVTALTVGETTITAVTTDGSFEAVASLTVLPVSVTGITIEPTNLKILLNSTGSLTPEITPENATNKAITWSSDDTSVATVDENGLVTGISVGNTTINGTTNDGSYTAISNIEVAEITSFIEVSFLTVSVSIINGNYSGTFGSTILNKSPVAIQLTQYEVYDGDTNALRLLANKTSNPDLFPSIGANESHGLQSIFNSFIYKPIFKWSFEYEGATYSILFQAP